MNADEILEALEAHLRESQPLDAIFYTNPNPTTADRAAYFRRQERAEALRHLFDAAMSLPSQAPNAKPETIHLTVAGLTKSGLQPLCRLSHDIRNLLHVILGSCELLADYPLDSDAAKLLEHISSAAVKAASLAKTTTCRIAEMSQQASKLKH